MGDFMVKRFHSTTWECRSTQFNFHRLDGGRSDDGVIRYDVRVPSRERNSPADVMAEIWELPKGKTNLISVQVLATPVNTSRNFLRHLARAISAQESGADTHIILMVALLDPETKKVLLQTENLRAEAVRVDSLLSDLLPYDIVRRLRRAEDIDLEYCECVTVMFSDVPIFSEIVGRVSPFQLFAILEHMCRTLDAVVAGFTVFKVETIRDSYMIVGGVPVHMGNQLAAEVANLALAMLNGVGTMPTVQEHRLGKWMVFEARVGIHSASRIQISTAAYQLLDGREGFKLESRGLIPIKVDLDFVEKKKDLLEQVSSKHHRKVRRFARRSQLD
ncbi:hypothetical protein RvY_10750 [Ramazzottius varieornatus]|uniref:Guanylate cyclase domain-containing protein n=1 Tax=Ramazzottius varieornatus TaxID=947166 RepID=A0A1D1VFU4_RAMVA|nr:hypothetical protein RvY_10750 [Ramazzottius varieornatus]